MSAFAGAAAPRHVRAWPALLGGGGSILLGGIAVVDPLAAVGLVVVLSFVLVAFRSLPWGVALFVVLMFQEHALQQVGAEILVKGAGGVLAVAWAAQLVRRRGESRLLVRDQPLVTAALLGLLVWAFASSLWAADSSVAISTAWRLSQAVLFLFIVYSAFERFEHFRLVVGAYLTGALIAALFGLATVGSTGRLGGDAGNPNEVAAFLLPAVVLCAFALLSEPAPLARFGAAAVGLIMLVALLLTGSRGGLIALVVALVGAVALAGPRRLPVAAAALVILGGVVVYYATAASPEQVERLSAIQDDGGTGRDDLWAVALEVARDRPLTGAGAGNFPVVEGQYAAGPVSIDRIDLVLDESKVAHNTYLEILSELGLVGLAFLVFVLLAALGSLGRAIRRLRHHAWQLQLPVRGLFVGLLGMLIAFTFTSSEYEKQLWLLVGTALALPALARAQAAPEPPVPAPAPDAWGRPGRGGGPRHL